MLLGIAAFTKSSKHTADCVTVENKRSDGQIHVHRHQWVSSGVDVTVPETGRYLVYASTPVNYLLATDWALGRVINKTNNKVLAGFHIGTGPADMSGHVTFTVELKKGDLLSSELMLENQGSPTNNWTVGHQSTDVILGIVKIN